MIREGMLAAFAKDVKNNIPDKDYWDDCKKSKTMFSSDDVKKM